MDYPATWQNEILMSPGEDESAAVAVYAEQTDKQLVELVLAGEEIAFERIFDRYKRLVAAVASRYFQRPDQIEEIIQISFITAYSELKNFRGEYDFSLASWLVRITTTTCLITLRNQKRKPENLSCQLSADEAEILFADARRNTKTAESLVVERDLAEKLLSRLPAEDRAILQMLYEEEMSIGEIANATGWSNSKIKVRAYRARNALRKILRKFV